MRTSGTNSRWARSVLTMFVAAVAVRLIVAWFLIPIQFTAENDHFSFGHEMGRVARSIALGQGYSSPLHRPTGPTAWVTPVWPYLLAGAFRVLGVYSGASLWFMLTLNSIFSGLTCWPIVALARKPFGERAALAAGWAFALFPYAVFVSVHWIWDATLTTLLLCLLLLLTLRLEEEASLARWLAYGLLWGLAALTNPAVLSVLPFWGAWLIFRLKRTTNPPRVHVAAAAAVFLLILAPWFLRNAVVFHRFIPLRSNFWLELRARNSPATGEQFHGWLHPSESSAEMQRFERLGEMAYMEAIRAETVEFLREHTGTFAWLTFKRIVHFWTGIWNLSTDFLLANPGQAVNIPFCTMVSVLALLGLRRAFRQGLTCAVPIALALLSFPLLYYITETSLRYRHPIDPLFVLLAGYAVVEIHTERPDTFRARRA